MIIDTRDLSIFNVNKRLNLDLYVVSCFRDRKFLHCYSYTTYEEAKRLYDSLNQLRLDIKVDYYLNKYSLKKYYLDSNDKYFLN